MPFPGEILPSGRSPQYRSINQDHQKEAEKVGDDMRRGLFVGYRFSCGRIWPTDYCVLDALSHANVGDGGRCPVLRAREVIPDAPAHWPVKDGPLAIADREIAERVNDGSLVSPWRNRWCCSWVTGCLPSR